MTLTGIITNSIVYRTLQSTFKTAGTHINHSYFLNRLSVPPYYSSQEAVNASVLIKVFSTILKFLLIPLTTSAKQLRKYHTGSKLLGLTAGAALSESQIIRSVAGARVETLLWLMVFYPVIDYIVRKTPALGFLSGSWDEILLAFIIVAWPAQMALRGNVTYRHTGMDIPISVYIGIAIFLLLMRSKNMSLAIEGVRVYIEYLLWFFIGSNLLLNRRQFDALMKGMVVVGTLVALVGVYQYVAGVETPAQWVDKAEEGIRTRAFSIVVSPNVLGSLLLLFIPLALAKLLNSRHRLNRLAYLAALTVMLACMVFTYSRGAWLAMGASIAVFSFMYSPRLLLIMGAGALAAIKMAPGIGSRLSYMLSPAYIASSERGGRLALWKMGLDRFMHDPLLGSGFGTYGGAVAARRVPGSTYVDNFYLKTMVESGIIGLLALLWIIAGALRHGYIACKKISDSSLKVVAAAVLAGLLGVALHNFVENIFEVPMMSSYFWLLSGMLLSLPHIQDN